MQETYVELYRIITKRGVDYVKNNKALCLRIAKQKLSHHYTFLERLKIFVSLISSNDNGDEVEATDYEDKSFSIEDFTVNQIILEEARRLIEQKPLNVKKVFYLFYDVGHTIPEIARLLSMSESNVKHKLYRTLKEFREILK
jgi:RNA polymerase sigma-70 factor (ECF subfamily)